MSFLLWLKENYKTLKKRKIRNSELRIIYDNDGFVIKADNRSDFKELKTLWSDVHKVIAYKRDLYAVDMICLVFELPGPTTVELNEEMLDWDSLIESLPSFLPGFPDWHKWWRDVAFPAFAANPHILFQRNSAEMSAS